MINNFCKTYGNQLEGKYDDEFQDLAAMSVGEKIKRYFDTLHHEIKGESYKLSDCYNDSEIDAVIRKHEGLNIVGFTPVGAFESLI
jgi:hypothetical protein